MPNVRVHVAPPAMPGPTFWSGRLETPVPLAVGAIRSALINLPWPTLLDPGAAALPPASGLALPLETVEPSEVRDDRADRSQPAHIRTRARGRFRGAADGVSHLRHHRSRCPVGLVPSCVLAVCLWLAGRQLHHRLTLPRIVPPSIRELTCLPEYWLSPSMHERLSFANCSILAGGACADSFRFAVRRWLAPVRLKPQRSGTPGSQASAVGRLTSPSCAALVRLYVAASCVHPACGPGLPSVLRRGQPGRITTEMTRVLPRSVRPARDRVRPPGRCRLRDGAPGRHAHPPGRRVPAYWPPPWSPTARALLFATGGWRRPPT